MPCRFNGLILAFALLMTERYDMLRLFLICCLFAAGVHADTVRLAVGLAKPPYIEAGGRSGLEVTLALATLRLAGHQPQVVQLPQARGLAMLDRGYVDAMLTLVPGVLAGICYSQPLLYYRNRAIVLQGSGIVLTQLSQLAQYRVAAFQNARQLLGDGFRQAVARSPGYTELGDQDIQNRMLFNRRTDVVVGDELIFHANPTQRDLNNRSQPVISYALFPSSPRHVGFRSERLCRDFDRALLQLKGSGEYERIQQSYRDKYRLPRN